ncbi:MAG: Acetyl-CoA hydrolase/transferase family protein [Pseudolabrys sp.]|jgi:acyl-CoA hydrolase|nr:Acetyl-CoA hydrolase/transferase family protein [Pseudolabrys sp.]
MTTAGGGPAVFQDAARLADSIVERVGRTIVLALPLGLGKANHIANALYAKAAADSSIKLTIFTGLTLVAPHPKNELERRFLGPVAARVFGGYPPLAYAEAIRAGTLPPNIVVDEFFLQAGVWLNSPYAQQHYISANYTHALACVLDRGVNVVAQLVAHRGDTFSLSCNPDLTLDLLELRRKGKANFIFAGETNSELPFMGGDAAIGAGKFDLLLDNPALDFPLFAPPREPITLADYAAGLHAATLVPDGGTLQIGIGSLGDAVTQALVLRHRKNEDFQSLIARLGAPGETAPFATGLYACTEMLVEGLLDLHRAGILKREVDGAVLHAGFFVGSRAFYKALRDMPPDIAAKFRMTSISYVNALYGGEDSKRQARVKARFLNDAMMATLLGDIVSDGLEDGRVISGVGGQYNFVAQAFALEGARAVMILRASRASGGKAQSNIRWSYGHVTIPRHLRDIVVTEYGVADLRGKSDRDVIAAMLNITDSRWQGDLLHQAKEAGKIEHAYEIPKEARDNTPDAIARQLKPARDSGLLPDFPFSTDFTEVERKLLPALQALKLASKRELLEFILRGMSRGRAETDCLERMGLTKPRGFQDRLYATFVRGALRQSQT